MRKVVIEGHGSLPFISGLSSGYAAAMGVELPIKIEIEHIPDSKDVEFIVLGEWDKDVKLIDRLKKEFIYKYLGKKKRGLRINIDSSIPSNIGLKSGTTVIVYTLVGLTHVLDLDFSENDIIHISANLSRASSSYFTGSLEGVYASLKGGVVYTDNMGSRIITWFNRAPNYSVLIGYGKMMGRSIFATTREIRRFGELFKRIFDVGQKGGHLKAITLNGILFSVLTNMDYETLVESLTEGAVAAGVVGSGPGIFVVVRHKDTGRFRRFLNSKGYDVLVTKPTNIGCSYKIMD